MGGGCNAPADYCDDALHAIAPNGSEKWNFTTGDVISSTPAIGADGTVYVGSDDGNLYAINSADGSEKWQFQTGSAVVSSPAIGSDGTIYIGSGFSNYGAILAIRPDGSERWSYSTNGPVYSSPAIVADGTVYFGSNNGGLYAFH
jgi:outer membrane protein assembly factor BamB